MIIRETVEAHEAGQPVRDSSIESRPHHPKPVKSKSAERLSLDDAIVIAIKAPHIVAGSDSLAIHRLAISVWG